jgi:hypothetical protein
MFSVPYEKRGALSFAPVEQGPAKIGISTAILPEKLAMKALGGKVIGSHPFFEAKKEKARFGGRVGHPRVSRGMV